MNKLDESTIEIIPTHRFLVTAQRQTTQYSSTFINFLGYSQYIHSPDSIPSLSSHSMFDDSVLITEYEFKRLEPPFDTNCFDYKNSTKSECLNDCYIEYYYKNMSCIPDKHFLISVDIEFKTNKTEIKFCPISDENVIQKLNQKMKIIL